VAIRTEAIKVCEAVEEGLGGSHAIYVSRPDEVAAIIKRAAQQSS
jgi:hypothetical protein